MSDEATGIDISESILANNLRLHLENQELKEELERRTKRLLECERRLEEVSRIACHGI